VQYSHPEWIVKRWLARYGAAECEAIAAANNAAPPKYFRINTARHKPASFIEMLREDGYRIEPAPFAEYFELVEGISARSFPPLAAGDVSVQDAAFAIPTKLVNPQREEMILEIGAAPGGKNTHIAEILDGDCKSLFALDITHSRNRMIAENYARLRIQPAHIITGDGANPPFQHAIFDKILFDAPCTSWGVVRRHPEIRWHRRPGDGKRLHLLQRKLLAAAHKLLKPHGIIIFATCTTEPEENHGALKTIADMGMTLMPIEGIPQKFIEAGGMIARTWCHRDNLDGSFCIVARK